MAFGKHSWALTSTEKEIKKGRKRQILMYFWALGFVEQNFTLFFHLRELPAYKLAYWVSLWQHKHTHTYTQIHKQIYGISGWLYLGALYVLQQRAGPFGKLRRIAPTVHNRSHSLIHTHTFSHTHTRKQSPFGALILYSPAKRQSESIWGSLHAFALSHQSTELNRRERRWDVNYTASPVKVT